MKRMSPFIMLDMQFWKTVLKKILSIEELRRREEEDGQGSEKMRYRE
jgi:hypothetical protein